MDCRVPLSVDWLALTLRLDSIPVGCPAGHVWAYYSSTNVWASRWCLFNEYGDKILTILFQPRQSIIPYNAAMLEIANEWLYHGIGFQGVLGLLSQVVKFEVRGISRLDLAADFCPDGRQIDIIKGLSDGRFYVAGKRNGSGFWSVMNDSYYPDLWRGRIPHCQSWGHKTSDIKWKLYYKTKELRDAVGGKGFDKPYIVDMWRDVGLDERNVWRLEVSVRNCNCFDFMGEKLTYERFLHSGSDLFQALYTSRFQVRRSEGHMDRSNDTAVPLLDVGRLSSAFKVRRRDVLCEHNGRLELLRHMYKDIQKEQVMLSDTSREATLSAMEQIIEADGFKNYFNLMAGEDFDSWCEWLRVRAYYFGVENLPERSDDMAMEIAMLESGLIEAHPPLNPLGAPSSSSQETQLRLF